MSKSAFKSTFLILCLSLVIAALTIMGLELVILWDGLPDLAYSRARSARYNMYFETIPAVIGGVCQLILLTSARKGDYTTNARNLIISLIAFAGVTGGVMLLMYSHASAGDFYGVTESNVIEFITSQMGSRGSKLPSIVANQVMNGTVDAAQVYRDVVVAYTREFTVRYCFSHILIPIYALAWFRN